MIYKFIMNILKDKVNSAEEIFNSAQKINKNRLNLNILKQIVLKM